MPHRVVALALPGVLVLDLAAPSHVFGHCGRPDYTFALAGLRAGPLRTSTGVAAGLDLCLHIVRRDLGAERAADLARDMVVPPHRDGGQAQFLRRPIERASGTTGPYAAGLQRARGWALEHLADRLTVEQLAAHAAVSPRTFARRFVEETGTTPAQWLLDQRTRAAQELLEHTDLSVEEVAARSGFGSSTALREHLRRRLQTTPTAYRRTFRTAATGA